MEIETLKDGAKRSLARMLNRSLEVEYDFLLNYPRMIDKLVNYDKITDKQLIKDLEKLGAESLRHFTELSQVVERLGGDPHWRIDTINRLEAIPTLLTHQLRKEKEVLALFIEAKRFVEQYKVKTKVEDFLQRLIDMGWELPKQIILAKDLMAMLDREIAEERNHIKLVEDAIATLEMLTSR